MRKFIALLLTACLGVSLVAAQDKAGSSKPATKPATSKPSSAAATASKPVAIPNYVISDCIAFKEPDAQGQPRTLVVKFRMDGNFDKYISAQFAYPKGDVKGAEAGKLFLFTFKQAEAAHNVEKTQPYDEKNPPKDLNDRNMIGKVVGFTEKAVLIEFVRDDNVKKFFEREQSFPIRNNQKFEPGQVIKVSFGPDNRHTSYGVVDDKAKTKPK